MKNKMTLSESVLGWFYLFLSISMPKKMNIYQVNFYLMNMKVSQKVSLLD